MTPLNQLIKIISDTEAAENVVFPSLSIYKVILNCNNTITVIAFAVLVSK